MIAQPETYIIEGSDTFVKIPYMRAKILFSAVADLNLRIRLDEQRIKGLTQSKEDLKTALALCEDIVSRKDEAIAEYKGIAKNKRKMWLRRVFYGTCGGLAAGLVGGIIIAK